MAVKKSKRNVLTDMDYDEVSFVRRGANPDAHIVLFKSDEDKVEKNNPLGADLYREAPLGSRKRRPKLTGGRGNNAHIRAVSCPTCGTKMSVAKSVTCECGTIVSKGTSDTGSLVSVTKAEVLASVLLLGEHIIKTIQAGAGLSDIAEVLQEHADHVSELAEDWVNDNRYVIGLDTSYASNIEKLYDNFDDVFSGSNRSEDMGKLSKAERAELSPSVLSYIEDLEKGIAPDEEEVSEGEENEETGTEEETTTTKKVLRLKGAKAAMSKSAEPEEIVKTIDDPIIKAAFEALLSKTNAANEAIEKSAEENALAKWVTMAKTWKYVPGNPEEIGANLRAIEKSVSVDAANAMAASLASSNEVASQSNIFKTRGSNHSGATSDSIEKAVKAELAKSAGSTGGNDGEIAKATLQALSDNPGLYEDFLRNKGA